MPKELKNISMRQSVGLKANLPSSGPNGQLYIARTEGQPSELWAGTGSGMELIASKVDSESSSYHPPLLSCIWTDHIVNDIQWLRSDTYSWQDGNVYQAVYNKLVEELGEKKQCYAYFQDNHAFWLESETPQVGDVVLGYGTTEHKVKCGTVTAVGDGYVQLSTITDSWDGTSWTPSGNYTRTPDEDASWYIQEMELTGGTPICYTISPSGFKIADPSKEQAILNKYNSSGITWYYILDTTNTRFKLPRTKYGFKGLRGNVGDDIAESLPSVNATITNSLSAMTPVGTNATVTVPRQISNPFGSGSGIGVTNYTIKGGSTYQDNAPVQERGTQMYLYFYVGDYTQTAIEQTAGITSEQLNNKVNKSGDTMTGQLIVQAPAGNFKAYSTRQELGAVTGARVNGGGLYMYDKNGKQTAVVQSAIAIDGTNILQMITRHPDDSAWGAYIEIGSKDGMAYISMPINQRSQITTWGFPNYAKAVTKNGATVYKADTNVWVRVQNHTNLGGGAGFLYAGTTSSPTIKVCRWGGNVASGEWIFYPIPKGWYYKADTRGLEGLTEFPCTGES